MQPPVKYSLTCGRGLPDVVMFRGNREDMIARMERDNQRLLDKIIENADDPDRKCNENILLIGATGSGKSALINSIYTSVTQEYRKVVESGAAGTQSKTMALTNVKKCGIKDHFIKNNRNAQKLKKVMDGAPNIFDFAGIGNINTPALKEVLQAIIHAYIRPGTNYDTIEAFQKRYGVGKLKQLFGYPRKEWKVSKVVFVHSAMDPVVPDKLIDCLNSVLREADPWTFRQRFRGSVFIVITKKDKYLETRGNIVSNILRPLSNQSDNDNPVEKALSMKFNFVGNLEYNRLWVTNYSDDARNKYKYDPELANMHLQLLFHLTLRNPNADDDDEVFKMSTWQYLSLEVQRLFRVICQPLHGEVPVSVVVVVALAAVFMYVVTYYIVPNMGISEKKIQKNSSE